MFTLINAVIFGAFIGAALIGDIVAARHFPKMKGWRVRGILMAALFIAVSTYAPFLWVSWLGAVQLLDLGAWPILAQIVVGYAALQFCAYWWHRALHKSDTLWRLFHQMHHSVERMDGWGALYHHPLDVIAFTFVGSFALTVIGGMAPKAVLVVNMIGLAAVLFTHANIKTPQWIGVIFQRPEGHGIHHQRDNHAGNYGELAVWDIVFGTWKNPKAWNGEAGFSDGASARIGEMLMGRDISSEAAPQADRERRPSRQSLA